MFPSLPLSSQNDMLNMFFSDMFPNPNKSNTSSLQGYAKACAKGGLSRELQQEVVKAAQHKVDEIAKNCVLEARAAVAQDPTTTKLQAKLVFAVNKTHRNGAITAIQDTLQKKYLLASTFLAYSSVVPLSQDTLLGDMSGSKTEELQKIAIKLTWVKGNPHVEQSPRQKPTSTYSVKDHFLKEWRLAQEGRFTDVTFVQKVKPTEGSLPSGSTVSLDDSEQQEKNLVRYTACSKKMRMHSPYFETLFNSNFKDSKNPVIEIPAELFEPFKYLLEFIYLGEVHPENKLDVVQLIDFFVCADFYNVEAAKQWCVEPLQRIFSDYEVDENEATRKKLVAIVNEKNWQWLYESAAPYGKVKQVLLNCARYNPKLSEFLETIDSKKVSTGGGGGGGGVSSAT